MTWDVNKARSTLALYGVRNFSINELGMVFVNTGLSEIEVEGIAVDNEGSAAVEFTPGDSTQGDNVGTIAEPAQ